MHQITSEISEQHLKSIEEISQKIEQTGNIKPYQLAQQMLRLMSGDSSVLKELPTLTHTLKTGMFGEGNIVLAEETSETSIQESRGLLGLTRENIIDIKTYVKTALSLKTTKEEVTKELGYTEDEPFSKKYPDFSPSSFAAFYTPFHNHALVWNDLETNIIDQGNRLQVYGTEFVEHAKFVLGIMEKMDLFSTIEDVSITDPDKKKLVALGTLLERWQKETDEHQSYTDTLLGKLTAFQEKLVNELSPAANSMSVKLGELDITEETAELRKMIDSLDAEVKAKQAEYDKDCGLACTGAAGVLGGPLVLITWSVTGGIYGAKAEKIRKEKNKLQGELAEKQTLYNSLNKVSASVSKATSGVENLKLAITNAIIGLKTLNAVWGLLSGYIESAKENLMEITNKSDLISCMFDFESAKSAWENVPGIAQGLLALFKEAEASLKLQNEFGNALILQNQVSLKTHNKRTWDDNYASLNQVIIDTASKYMPVLHSKAKELQGDANQVYDLTQNELPHTVLIVGEQAMLSANPVLLDKLEDAAANDPYDKKSLEIFNRYICELRKKAGKFSSELDRIDKGITDNVSIISGNIQQNLKSLGFFAQLNNECKRFEQVLQNHTKLMEDNFILPMQVLQEKLKALDASIEEKTDPAHIIKDFKEFLPSSDEVSDMLSKEAKNREEAKLAEVKILYETFLKSIDTMAEVVSICSQTEKRSHLASELSDLRHKFEEVKKGYLDLLKSQRDLNQLLMLYDRLLFFVEAGKEQAESIRRFRKELDGYLSGNSVNYKAYYNCIMKWKDKSIKK